MIGCPGSIINPGRITRVPNLFPSGAFSFNDNLKEKSGITIEYLIRIEHEQFTTGSFRSSYDWFKEEFIFISKEELLQKIV